MNEEKNEYPKLVFYENNKYEILIDEFTIAKQDLLLGESISSSELKEMLKRVIANRFYELGEIRDLLIKRERNFTISPPYF